MKRRLAGILILLLLLVGASAEDYRRLRRDGVEYEYNSQVTALLYAGIDSQGRMQTTDRYTIAPRADAINLIVLDGYRERIRVLAISRDTLARMTRYTMDGTYRDEYVSQLGYAYTYGDGGRISCENLCNAVSTLLGGVPVHEYVVSNMDGVARGNEMAGGVQVTVPNDDVAELHPELTAGAQVVLDAENVLDYVRYRDVSLPHSNVGRMQRQESFLIPFLARIQQRLREDPEQIWRALEDSGDYIQTSVTRSEYLSLADRIAGAAFDADDYFYLSGEDATGARSDVFVPDAAELQSLVLELFYLER